MAAALVATGAQAELFGSGANEFELTFQGISSGSNPWDAYGHVVYDYGIGTHEITADQWGKYVAAGVDSIDEGYYAPKTTGGQAANNISWNEAAQFVNWLNTSKGHQAAYDFEDYGMRLWGAGDRSATSAFRHKDAVYVLPDREEWVKAAYWNGTSIQTYATPDDTPPTTTEANYDYAFGSIWSVGTGAEELNGTYDMMGNVWEWHENGFTSPDDSATEARGISGGAFSVDGYYMRSRNHFSGGPTSESPAAEFRVAVIPEPSSIMLMGVVSGFALFIRRWLMM